MITPEVDIYRWLADATFTHPRLADLYHAFCDQLLAAGIPIWRAALGLEVLDPETSGAQFRWLASEASLELMPRSGVTDRYSSSPVRIIDETERTYRRRLGEAVIEDLPLLEELRQSGVTDYLITPLAFLERRRSAYMSFATRQPGGFSDEQVAALERAAVLFSPYAERHVLRRTAIDLLTTYLGRRSGERVFSGAIERGTVENIRAAICIADLRGFTRFSDEQPRELVLATLNAFFGVAVDAVEDRGGEVLKFIGDGLLAIFPEIDGSLAEPSCAAVSAVRAMIKGVAELNRQRKAEPAIAFGAALHVGDLAYGNIGGRKRLDFTVIGSAVNHTSRLLELSKKLERTVIMSGALAEQCTLPLARLGKYRLRDVSRSHEVYTLEEMVAEPAKSARMSR
jgi:adenylate cyclase